MHRGDKDKRCDRDSEMGTSFGCSDTKSQLCSEVWTLYGRFVLNGWSLLAVLMLYCTIFSSSSTLGVSIWICIFNRVYYAIWL